MGQVKLYVPKIGKKVYCIYRDGIFVDTVAYIGKDSFIIDGFRGSNDDIWEWGYEDYNTKWFTSFTAAKKALIDIYQPDYSEKLKLVKITDDWYELEF